AYRFRLSTVLWSAFGSTLAFGTLVAPMPRDSTFLLEFDCASDGQFGLVAYGAVTINGQSRTAGKLVTQCLLSADEAAGQTTLSGDCETGWLRGDVIAIASPTRPAPQGESRILDGNAGAVSLDVTVALTNAHGGVAPVQSDLILRPPHVPTLFPCTKLP